jgi:hypothetical protein
MSIEVMKQALDALKKAKDDADNYLVTSQQDVRIMGHIVSLIEAELAKPEQKPVAKVVLPDTIGLPLLRWLDLGRRFDFKGGELLYVVPPRKPWVGLNWDDIPDVFVGDIAFMQGAKWAQAKLKEKNGG